MKNREMRFVKPFLTIGDTGVAGCEGTATGVTGANGVELTEGARGLGANFNASLVAFSSASD